MLLEVKDLETFYGDSQALHGTSLNVEEGEHVGIIGRNGMGKTTLVHTIMGFLRPRRGSVTFSGREITGVVPEVVSRAGITVVPQGRRVFGSLTVGENLRVSEQRRGDDDWTVEEVCEHIPILGDRFSQVAGLMSGGQQQMLSLGRALVGNGRLMLMDEPSEGLDQHHLALVAATVRELHRRGTAVVLVEQKLRFALDLVATINIMDRGRMVESASAEEVRRDPDKLLRGMGFGTIDAAEGDVR